MQITSGWSKGLKILTPEGLDTRPTRERVRSSALNMLQPWIQDARVLDLFAGSGAVGLELISRGAAGCHFVENGRSALTCIRQNMNGLAARAARENLTLEPFALSGVDAQKMLGALPDEGFDLVWADPPYDLVEDFMTASLSQFARLLTTDSVFALESSDKQADFLEQITPDLNLTKIKQRAYGVSLITIWQK